MWIHHHVQSSLLSGTDCTPLIDLYHWCVSDLFEFCVVTNVNNDDVVDGRWSVLGMWTLGNTHMQWALLWWIYSIFLGASIYYGTFFSFAFLPVHLMQCWDVHTLLWRFWFETSAGSVSDGNITAIDKKGR